MTIKIYSHPTSPAGRAVFMLTEILNLKYEFIEVSVMAGDTRKPEYLEKNPNHTIPMIEDDGYILIDSHAILTYLVEKYGAKQAQLYPKDLQLRSTVLQRLFFEASTISAAFLSIFLEIAMNNGPGPNAAQLEKSNDVYNILDKYLSKSKFVAADHLTIADLACISTISTMANVSPIDAKYEKLTAWYKSLSNEEWFKKGNLPGLTAISQYLKSVMEKNSKA
ncbi:glutathione S-transferase D7-like [Trichoplusia ni]|uniref:Glutathione S-transferase D7-like n=1 Tax=Trichoplusia ni TaxID=7111 RepID=A0A7E5WSE8_TRINI|nr:glutathione S-transferase D7-like [Trichoplusia ni]